MKRGLVTGAKIDCDDAIRAFEDAVTSLQGNSGFSPCETAVVGPEYLDW